MPTFLELPVRFGDGPVHINYFRIYIRPKAGLTLPTGLQLLQHMPDFMDPHTAKVRIEPAYRWAGFPSLSFRGVGRARSIGTLVPEKWREAAVPQLHIDAVGLAVPPLAHAFTALTLKRNFETSDDLLIRQKFEKMTEEAPDQGTVDKVMRVGRMVLRPDEVIKGKYGKAAADHAVFINQHHFLAGRRSFRMGTVAGLELHPGIKGTDWVFETAAFERYSLPLFGYATNLGMGGAAVVVRPVWTEMVTRVAHFYGTQVGQIGIVQQEFGTIGAAKSSPAYADIKKRHVALVR